MVHGAWHGAGHWAPLAGLLAARGHRVLALDLPGHGMSARFPVGYFAAGQPGLQSQPSPLVDVTLETAAQAVVAAARDLPRRPVLVAHSMGGAVATRAAELAPELFEHLVYVTAFVPTRLKAAGAYLALPEAKSALGAGLYLGDPAVTGAVRINPRSTDEAYLDELHAAYFTGLGPEQFLACAAALTPDQPVSFLASDAGATPQRWGRLRRTYVRCTLDRALPLELQDLMIRDADHLAPHTRFAQETIESGHAAFASRTRQLADILDAVTV
ncbi:alpha/beta hydrolase [Dactylosporangium sp. NPDC000521]|uniref:alpha/beta hydrolase n=1 Tax=Dactylosporangium sp. NPDC000521 TaxID=3363975 RepID=UPI0036A6FBA7